MEGTGLIKKAFIRRFVSDVRKLRNFHEIVGTLQLWMSSGCNYHPLCFLRKG